jgi:hypothetical protein
MRHRTTLSLVAPIALVALFPGAPAFAGHGAVAYDQDVRKRGFAWDEPSQEHANEPAKRDCGSVACKVRFEVGPKTCAALAVLNSGPARGGAVANQSTRPSSLR